MILPDQTPSYRARRIGVVVALTLAAVLAVINLTVILA